MPGAPNAYRHGPHHQRAGLRVRANRLADLLARRVGQDHVLADSRLRAVYESDAYTLEKAVPELVVFPGTPEETAEVVAAAVAAGAAVVPRGAGTSLAGGCLAGDGTVVVCTSRLTAIETLDAVNRQALVGAGVVNLELTRAARRHGLHFAPDPSSQPVATIGGNIANNSGGPHTLKYGVTAQHVAAVEWATPDGRLLWSGDRSPAGGGADLTGLVVGSEGTFGVVTRAWVRLTPEPPAVRTLTAAFPSTEAAAGAVSGILASGVTPAAVELMDRRVLHALSLAFSMSFSPRAEALLLVEVDGLEIGLDDELSRVAEACREAGALLVTEARENAERARLWMARKRAFGALGRLARNFCTQDGVVPRSRLPQVLTAIDAVAERHGVAVANVFHAGDGNLHPVLLYDERNPAEVEAVLAASYEILELCLREGGSLTGEHGIGVEKIDLMDRAFSPASLEYMRRVRAVFDPVSSCNPGKAVPAGGGCPDDGPRRALGRVRPGREVSL